MSPKTYRIFNATWIAGTILSSSALAVPIYTVSTYQPMSQNELSKICNSDLGNAETRLKAIEQQLALPVNTLSVSGQYGVISHNTGSPQHPSYSYEYYCVLDFKTKLSEVQILKNRVVRYTRLGRTNWDTACEPAYKESENAPSTAVTVLWKAWTLIQGRMCEVQNLTIQK